MTKYVVLVALYVVGCIIAFCITLATDIGITDSNSKVIDIIIAAIIGLPGLIIGVICNKWLSKDNQEQDVKRTKESDITGEIISAMATGPGLPTEIFIYKSKILWTYSNKQSKQFDFKAHKFANLERSLEREELAKSINCWYDKDIEKYKIENLNNMVMMTLWTL